MPLGAKDLVAVFACTDLQLATQPFVPLCIVLAAEYLATIATTILVAVSLDHLPLDGPPFLDAVVDLEVVLELAPLPLVAGPS